MRTLPVLLCLTLTACGGELFYVEAEAPLLCTTLPGPLVPGEGAITERLELELGGDLAEGLLAGPDGLETELRLHRVALIAPPSSDLSFIEKVTVSIGPRQVEIARLASPARAGAEELALVVQPVELTSLLSSTGGTRVSAAIAGTLPASPWRADLEVCAAARVKYRYLETE